MTRALSPEEQAALHWLMMPARIVADAMKDEWRAQRERDRAELGLPPWEREGEDG